MRLALRRGFTLLELSIALMLVGMMAGMYLTLTKSTNSAECYATVKKQTQTIKDAIERFAMKNDRFPIPAARNIGVSDQNYGREAGTVAQIVANATLAGIDEIDGALFGAVPFQALGIPVENASDCWGNKYTYAMTKELANPAKFLDPNTVGKLKIKTNNTIVFLQEAGYAIISHGADELGAVESNYSGTGRKWCASSTELRTQNCDITNTDLISTEYNDGKNGAANFFDDVIVYRGKPWRKGGGSNLYCWGRDQYGRLGINGSGSDVAKPTMTEGGITFSTVALGAYHACGLDMAGKAYCWGRNQAGQLGIGSTGADVKVPTAVVGTDGTAATALSFSSISAGFEYTCAIQKTTGHAYCWGTSGQNLILGNPSGLNYTRPQQVVGPGGTVATALSFKQLAAGYNRVCAITTADGRPYCWGFSIGPHYGFPGCSTSPTFPLFYWNTLTPIDNFKPKPEPGPSGNTTTQYAFQSIDAVHNMFNFCGVDLFGKAFCLGNNTSGQVGNNATNPAQTCVFPYAEVRNAAGASPGDSYNMLSVGSFHTCAIKNDKVYCWGSGSGSPLLGREATDASSHLRPSVKAVVGTNGVAGSIDFRVIAAGDSHNCALTPAGKAYCWGSNNRGQFGRTASATQSAIPQEVFGPSGTTADALAYKMIAAAGEYSCAIVGTPEPATVNATPLPVNGVCGTVSGTACDAGTSSAVTATGPGTVSWNCVGLNGGTTANCSGNTAVCDSSFPRETPTCAVGNSWGAITGTTCSGPGQSINSYNCYCTTPPCISLSVPCTTTPVNNMACP